jgi:uncharacterized membrane protein (UPF0182 family)
VLNLLIADRLAPLTFSANMHPVVERFHDLFGRRLRLVRICVAVFFGLLFALPATGQWTSWLLFRNSKSFGIEDAQFGNDISFYVFRLPFITFALDWLFAALIFVTSLVSHPRPERRCGAAAPAAQGAPWHQGAHRRAARPARRREGRRLLGHPLRAHHRKARVRAGRHLLGGQRPAARRGAARADRPARRCAVPVDAEDRLVALPVVASALWAVVALVGGVIYPAAVQALVVNPNQKDREALYIERNIEATRQALDIVDVPEEPVTFNTLTAGEIAEDITPLQDTRLLNPSQMIERFRADQGQRAGLTIRDLDIDRYELDGREQQVLVAARELDLGTIANKSWQGRHLISTHGCGLTIGAGEPGQHQRPAVLRARRARTSRAVLQRGARPATRSCAPRSARRPVPGRTTAATYEGEGGIALDSVFKRMAFALDFLDYNLLGSSAVTDESRIFWIRNVRERVEKVAPFLAFDGDPYPVELDGAGGVGRRRLHDVVAYPYAQDANTSQLSSGSGLDFPFNYVRNSVKAVVNAYDGSMQFYIADASDPIVNAWADAFPDLFAPIESMPPSLREHLRYPEDLFRIQTEAYSKYRLVRRQPRHR